VTDGVATTTLDDVTTAPGVEGSSWLQIRRHLDVQAFGVNGYRADAGGRVIEEHDEVGGSAGRHEELYVVVRGRAHFTVGGDDVDAPAGTLLYVEPETMRGAIAEEDGTTVLVIGGKPGDAFRVSPWEATADAWAPYRAKDYEAAIAVFERVLADYPEAQTAGTLYNLACCEALAGRADEAIEHLRGSIALEDRFRELAQSDEDFDAIRDRADFPR
jgi:tetratricopeptide (TPR) repeat protein